jgi:hypothetical protein
MRFPALLTFNPHYETICYCINCIIPIFTIAQGQSPKISGIGRFKIGSTTTALIEDISKEFSSPIKETNDIMETSTNYYDETPLKFFIFPERKTTIQSFLIPII